MFQNKYVSLIGQISTFMTGGGIFTYGPGPVLVLGNEALEPLERAKPRKRQII